MASTWTDSDFELQSQPADWMDSGLMHEQTLSRHGSPPVTARYQGQASSNSSHGSLISEASEWSSHIALNIPHGHVAPLHTHQGINGDLLQHQHVAAHDTLQATLGSGTSMHSSHDSFAGLLRIDTPHINVEADREAPVSHSRQGAKGS
jgi:hypothetical protein